MCKEKRCVATFYAAERPLQLNCSYQRPCSIQMYVHIGIDLLHLPNRNFAVVMKQNEEINGWIVESYCAKINNAGELTHFLVEKRMV